MIAAGLRNAYDIDFNADGELFTYDSDMEWDVGLPWYRPTRILHIIPGAEFGFREGCSKWPDYYADSLPAVVNIGRGSPTGVKFGTRSNFPEKYKSAFFVMDWTYGRILAVHIHPKGASYTASNPLPSRYDIDEPSASEDVEVFVSGKGLPVTDLEFGKDGAMYFTVGGRGTQAGLYRVSYVGSEKPGVIAFVASGPAMTARHERRLLELNAHTASSWIAALSSVNYEDRCGVFAARIALESIPLEWLRPRALSEANPKAGITALLALARVGSQSDQEPLLKALTKFPLDSLDDEWKLNKLRVIEVSLMRQGRPSEEMVKLGIEKLSRQFPAKSFDLNRELSQLLVWLDAPDVVEKTLALMRGTSDHAEQIWYANVLREAKQWTPAQREQYFAWFNAAADYKGGNSAGKFILRIREEALKRVPDAEREHLAALFENKPTPVTPPPPAVARNFQKAWTVADLTPDLAQAAKGRNFSRGKEIFASVQCAQCHHFGKDGGNVGPDLSAVGNRFNAHDLLEAIIEPSKAISEQYASVVVTMKDGGVFSGLIAEEDNHRLRLVTDPVAGKNEWLRIGQIASREVSKVSLMPPGLINVLTKDEILDLLAYLASGGNEKAPAFAK
jgi:putative heme-binding domain-containing protein